MADQVSLAPKVIEYDDVKYTVVKEGLAEILDAQSPMSAEKDKQSQQVFYNPIQQFNRDLSVLAIRVFGEDRENARKLKEQAVERRSEQGSRKRKRIEHPEGNTDGDHNKRVANDFVVPTNGQSKIGSFNPFVSGSEAGHVQSTSENLQEAVFGVASVTSGSDEHGLSYKNNLPKPARPSRLRILDALSATGLRALRYAKEVPVYATVTANDLSKPATSLIKLNARHNELLNQVFPLTGNALAHMYHVASDSNPLLPDGTRGKYHVIDLDPYGTAVPFLDAAIQATVDGGMLCVTCTDSGVFASCGYSEKTFSQYGGLPLRGAHAHEAGLRLVLHAVATSAARYGVAVEPLLSLSIDFYIRVFVRVRRSPNEVKLLAGKTMTVYNCDSGCGAWVTQPIARTTPRQSKSGETVFKFTLAQAPSCEPYCEHCNTKMHLAGPMWAGPLHNPFFIQRILDLLPSLDSSTYPTIPRIEGMLATARDEILLREDFASATSSSENSSQHDASVNGLTPQRFGRLPPELVDPHPFFFLPSSLARVLHCVAPSYAALRSAFLGLGYRTTRSHTKPGSMRTDAPWSVIWEVMREWSRQHAPVKEGVHKEGTAGWGIMRNSRVNPPRVHVQELRDVLKSWGNEESLKASLQRLLEKLNTKLDETAGDRSTLDEEAESEGQATTSETSNLGALKVVFDESKGKEANTKKLVRYQINPRPNWGPMNRAKVSAG